MNTKWRKNEISLSQCMNKTYNEKDNNLFHEINGKLFNPDIYRNNYLDLQLLKYDNNQLYIHYYFFGNDEGRVADFTIPCVKNVDFKKDYNKVILKYKF